ncbi:MAG TPA: proton-conducting transporter membrane subunit [Ruminiclostridium sp.]
MTVNHLIIFFITCVVLYLIGALSSLLSYSSPKISNQLSNTFALVASGLLSIIMLYKLLFLKDISLNFNTNIPFLSLDFNIDNLSAFFILIISIVTMVVSLYSYTYMSHYFYIRNVSVFGFFYNLFILSMILLTASSNLLLFLIFWELMSLLSYFLVIYEHEKEDVQKAGRIYIIMTFTGTAFITAAFVLMAYWTKSFDLATISESAIPSNYANIIYVFLLLGFGTKAGIIPVHVWLPYAHPVAPSNVSALMSGVMIKMSIYGLLRMVFDVLPDNAMWWGVLTLVIGAISAILGIAYSVASTINIKRLLAYSSIENMGIIFCGLGITLIARATDNTFLLSLALTATLLHTLNHAVFKSLLFMSAGAIQYSAHTRNMEKLGGLIKKMPIASVFIFVGCLAISAVPPFNGFISEYIIFQTIINCIIWFAPLGQFSLVILFMIVAAMLALTGALVAYGFVKLYGVSFLGVPRSADAENAKEPKKPMLVALGISASLCLVLGIFPKYIIGLIDNVSNECVNLKLLSTNWSLTNFLHYPIEKNNLNISVSLLTIIIMIFVGIVALIVMALRKRTSVQRYNTWDCGFTKLNPKMQYSATGYSKSLRIIFRGLFKPNRDLVITEGYGPYYIKNGNYTITTEKVIEKYLYKPFIKMIINFSRKIRFKIQTGSIHAYLMYFFSILILMLLYYSFMG